MAIQGKKKFQIYLDEENFNFIKNFLDVRNDQRGGMSGLIDRYLDRQVYIIKHNPEFFNPKLHGKMTVGKFLKLLKLKTPPQDGAEQTPA